MNSSAFKIAIEVDDRGSVKVRKFGDNLEHTAKKGKKSFKDLATQMAKTEVNSGALAGKVGGVAAGLGAMAAAGVLVIQNYAAQAREIENLARLAGTGSERFQNLAYATEQVGINQDQLADISKDVKDKLGDFISTGGGEFADFFENVAPKVGLTAQELQGLSGPDVLVAVKKAMDDVNLSAEEQIFYLESIGNDASKLTPLLEDSGTALYAEADAADALGLALSEIESDRLLEADIAVNQLTGVFGALKNSIAADLSPVIVGFTNGLLSSMHDGETSVDNLALTISTGLLQSFDYALAGVEFVHVGWVKLEAAIPSGVNAFVHGGALIFDALTNSVLLPLDAAFTGLEKVSHYLGEDFVNPLDTIKAKIANMGDITQGVMEDSFDKIIETEQGYDDLRKTTQTYIQKVIDLGEVDKEVSSQKTSLSRRNIAQVKTETSTVTTLQRKAADDALKAAKKAADEREELSADLLDKTKRLTLTDLEYKEWALEEEIELLREKAGDDIYVQKQVNDYRIAALDDLKRANKKASEEMSDDWIDFGREMKNAFSKGVGNIIMESFGEIDNAWEGLWASMLSTLGQKTAEMAVDWVASGVGSLFDGWDIFHDGSWDVGTVLGRDELPAIIQKGEMIIPVDHAQQIRDNLGGLGSKGDSFAALVNVTEHGANPGEWKDDPVVSALLKNSMSSLKKSAVAHLIAGNYNPASMIQHGLLNPHAFVGIVSKSIEDVGLEASGKWGNWSSLGQTTVKSMAMLALAGGPVGVFAGSLGGIVGAFAGDAIGDALDDREFEELRDAWEDGLLTDPEYQEAIQDAKARGIHHGSIIGSIVDFVKKPFSFVGDLIQAGINIVTDDVGSVLGTDYTPISLPDLDYDLGFTSANTLGAYDKAMGDIALRKERSFSYKNGAYAYGDSWSYYGGGDGDKGGHNVGGAIGSSTGTGGGYNMGGGKVSGLAQGGVVTSLYVPDGDDGLKPMRFNEGVIAPEVMDILQNQIRSGSLGGNHLVAEMKALRNDINAALFAVADNTRKTAKILQMWQANGMPEVSV